MAIELDSLYEGFMKYHPLLQEIVNFIHNTFENCDGALFFRILKHINACTVSGLRFGCANRLNRYIYCHK